MELFGYNRYGQRRFYCTVVPVISGPAIYGILLYPEEIVSTGRCTLKSCPNPDYTKELQFRALEKSSQGDERCSVIRDSHIERINPKDLVVGDVILLQAGDMIPADSIICDGNVIKCNESALTGESDDLNKSKRKDCFLLSSCLVTEGEEAHALLGLVHIHNGERSNPIWCQKL